MKHFSTLFILLVALIPLSCSGQSQSQTDAPEKSYHPGHYINVKGDSTFDDPLWKDCTGVQGFQKSYSWRDLEPEKGKYDFSEIEADLKLCKKLGKQLVIFFREKSFDFEENDMPVYLEHLVAKGTNGITPLRWTSEYLENIKRILSALAEKFDNNPYLEGITFQESALSLTDEGYNALPEQYAYTPAGYVDAILDFVGHCSDVFKRTQTIWFVNFIPRDGNGQELKRACYALAEKKVVIAGPDILPYRIGLNKEGGIYDLQRQLAGVTPLGDSVQASAYKHHKNDQKRADKGGPVHEEGYVPLEDIFLFGRDSLKLNYIFWAQVFVSKDVPHNSFYDALDVINKYPEFNR